MNKTKFWEKTVEYQFVINNHHKFQMIAPLDGEHEKQTSDTIVGQGDKFILIEFKRDNNSQSAEFKKFAEKENDKILTEIEKIKNHQCHFLVYGEIKIQENKSYLQLFHKKYLCYLKKCESSYTYDEMLKYGVAKEEFIEYLEAFGKLRIKDVDNNNNDNDSTGGSKAPEKITIEFSDTLILDNKGNCLTFNDFQIRFNLQLKQKNIKKIKFNR